MKEKDYIYWTRCWHKSKTDYKDHTRVICLNDNGKLTFGFGCKNIFIGFSVSMVI